MTACASCHYVLRYQPLSGQGTGYAFPCDVHGQVDLDRLNDHLRNDYLYARAMVGRELARPAVEADGMH